MYIPRGVLGLLLLTLQTTQGALDLLLSGYDNIPNDDTALVAISDIGTHAEGTALICRHHITGIPSEDEIDNWNYIPEDGQEVRVNSDIGWSVSRGQNEGEVRLERIAGVSPLEGTYRCEVRKGHLNPVETETVDVHLYWPITDIEVDIEVVSQETQQYNVSCRSMGGSVVSSSLTGPDGENLGQLLPVEGQQDLRGADNYSISVLRTGGAHGDVFMCTASSEGSAETADTTLSVAGPPGNVNAAQVSSHSPTLNVSWDVPQEGAAVTGYTVHYSGADSSGNKHSGSVNASIDTTVLIHNLLADGRSYNLTVEAHSVHLSGYSKSLDHELCLVLQLSVVSRNANSLSIMWERPSYYDGPITALIQYRALPNGDAMWLYVVDSGDTLPVLAELTEFTNYSVQIAAFDSTNTLCVFSQPIFALTGLGAVNQLQAQADEDGILISWSPPITPSNIIVNYTLTYSGNGGVLVNTETTQNLSWRIRALQGDVYTVTVAPLTDSGPGESSTIIAGLDYEPFQLLIDDIGRCGAWININADSKLSYVASTIEQAMNALCSCAVQIQMPLFDCRNENQDFATFRGQLFAPTTISADELLALLDNWVTSGNAMTVLSVNSNCRPSTLYADDAACVTSEAVTVMDDRSEDTSVGIVASVAVGCFVVGMMIALVSVLSCYLLKKRFNNRRDSNLQARVRRLTATQSFHENERYISTTARDLPPTPDAVSFANPSTKEGACGKSSEVDGSQAYELVPTVPKVENPLYGDTQPAKPPISSYEDIDKLREQKEMASEYEMMNSVSRKISKTDTEK